MQKNYINSSLNRKISLIVLAMIILSTTVVSTISYLLYRRDSIDANAERAEAIAETIASAIDPVQFVEIFAANETNKYWLDTKRFVDNVAKRSDVMYLYVLDKNYDENVKYFVEGDTKGNSDTFTLGDEESIEYHADEMFGTLESGNSSTTDIYDAEEYGMMVSGFAPILDGNTVVGVVGVDLSLASVMESTNFFGFAILICEIVLCLIFWFISGMYIKRNVGKPIKTLSKASAMIAKGDMNISLVKNSHDEIGVLTESFLNMVDSTNEQIAALQRIASKDLTANIIPRCEQDSMGGAMKETIESLNNVFNEIKKSSLEVYNGSNQIAEGSRTLAEGASEQAAAIQQLSSSLTEITYKADQSAEMANTSASLAGSIMQSVEKGNRQMSDMINAVGEIDNAGTEILKVIKVINDIAFQTNILALNASVEAARAGQHGKGFAVVAGEVRNLASKSADAAKDTEKLIANSVEKAALGSQIAHETANTLNEIVTEIKSSNKLSLDIVRNSKEQADAINQMGISINQVSEVIQNNSAAAEESAASSAEMSRQANILEGLIEEFRL